MNVHIEKRQRADRKWSYRVVVKLGKRDPGGPARIPIGTRRTYRGEGGALELAEAARREYEAGTFSACKLTVRELIELWLRDGPVRKRTTMHGYRTAADDHIYKVELEGGVVLGNIPAAKVTPAQWAAWQADQLTNGRVGGGSLKPKSVRGYRAVACGAYNWAVEIGLLRVNPLSRVKPPRLPNLHVDVPDLATMGAYVDEVRGTRYWMPLVLGTAAMRRGEVLGLRWCDYDQASGEATIRRQVLQAGDEVWVEESTKTDAGYRVIPLSDHIRQALKEHRREVAAKLLLAGKPWDEQARICGEIDPDDLTHGLHKLFLLRGLPPVNMHKLRHAVVTDMVRRGTNPKAVARYVGHSSSSVTTLAVYTHAADDDVADAMEGYARAWNDAQAARRTGEGHHFGTKKARKASGGGGRVVKMPAQEGKD